MRVEVLRGISESNGLGKINGIKIVNLPENGKQKLLPKWLKEFKQFVTKTEEQITLHTVGGDVVFHIDHACINDTSTRYCLTCDELLPDSRADPFAEQCKEHVKAHGKSAETSERWPPGYMVVNSYECTIEDQRHG